MKESRLRTRGLYALPGVAVPSGQRCIQLMVPDDPAGVRQALGALYELTHWNNWERDASHAGTEWAKAWKAALAASIPLGECEAGMFDIRIDPENDCMLQKTENGGETWQDVGSFHDCAYNAAGERIQDAIEDGELGRRGQEPPGGALPAQECHTYHVELRGQDQWHCPVPVSAGFTIHVTNASGGWGDGSVQWFCPDGAAYLLGQCRTDQKYMDENDPLPTAYHGQIIGGYGETPVYFDPMAATFQIPTGIQDVEFVLQMNDTPISDNLGSVQFDVEVCNAGFCYYWNFELDDYDWSAAGYGEYVPGVGFRTMVYGGMYSLFMQKVLPGGQTRVFYKARVHYIQGVLGGSDVIAWWRGQGNWVRLSDNTALAEGDHTIDMVLYQDGTYDVMLNPSGYGIGPCTIKEVWLWGFGTNPFGEDNCS